MRQYIIFLVLLVIPISCLDQTQVQNNEYDKARKRELSKNVRYDTIFLGLRFGMTEKETYNYLTELSKREIISSAFDSSFSYNFDFGQTAVPPNATGYIHPQFYEGKLFRLGIYVQHDRNYDIKYYKEKLFHIYSLKYGSHYIRNDTIFKDGPAYVWIDGNREIEISINKPGELEHMLLPRYVDISYTDLVAQEKKTDIDVKEMFDEMDQKTDSLKKII